jgi:hypothetical protein
MKWVRLTTLTVLVGVLLVIPSPAFADGGPYYYGTVYQVHKLDGTYEQFQEVSLGNCPGASYAMEHRWQTSGGWSSWSSLGGCAYSFDVGMNSSGREEVFVDGTNAAIWHNWQENPGSGPWSGWYQLGSDIFSYGPWTGSYMSPNWQANLHVYAEINGTRYVNYQTSPGCCWSGWHVG